MHPFVVGQGVLCPRVAINFGMMMTRGDSIPSTVRIKTPATTLLSRIGLVVVGAGVIIGYCCNVLYDEHIYIRNAVMTL